MILQQTLFHPAFQQKIQHFIRIEAGLKQHNFRDSNRQQVYHYEQELIRYWSKIHFMLQKTIRALGFTRKKKTKILDYTMLYFLTYRYFWENASINHLIAFIREGKHQNKQTQQYIAIIKRLPSFSWKIALKNKSPVARMSIQHAQPSFLIEMMQKALPINQIRENLVQMDHFSREGAYYIRINQNYLGTIGESINWVRNRLAEDEIYLTQIEPFDLLFKCQIKDKAKIVTSELYKKGIIIGMSKASYSAMKWLDVQPKEHFLDLCAAPGMKTSVVSTSVSAANANPRQILANDFNFRRVQEINNVYRQLHLAPPHLLNSDGFNPPIRPTIKFDKILIDAPCTGSGNFANSPELKWRQSEQFLGQHCFMQRHLLETGLSYIKPGGIILYATCSLYPEEGEEQIEAILDQITLHTRPEWIPSSYEKYKVTKETGRFLPKRDNSEGFFLALFEKKA